MIYIPETTVTCSSHVTDFVRLGAPPNGSQYYADIYNSLNPQDGDVFPVLVVWNGEHYETEIACVSNASTGRIEFGIGNLSIITDPYSGEPFYLALSDSEGAIGTFLVVTNQGEGPHTFSVMDREETVEPEPDTATYRWKVKDNALISVGKNDNPITTLEGGIVNGVFSNARYKLAKPFNLRHDKDWAVEWVSKGAVDNGGAMAKLWDESGLQTSSTSESIILRATTHSISLSRYEGSHYHYGVDLREYSIDYTAEHIYRLQNKVNADGTNMVWLYVDGKEIAPMRSVFGGDSGESDWVVGKDFSFGYMGTPRYILNGFIMDDIAVWESGANEAFPEEMPEISRGTLFLLYRMFSREIFKALTGKTHWTD